MAYALIPAYNEQSTVAQVVAGVQSIGLVPLVIDDGSTDDTAHVARRAGATVLRLPVNLGVGGALRCGFRYAHAHGASRVVQVDADLQHDVASIPDLLAAADAGHELVIGSRFGGDGYHGTFFRRIPMRLLARIMSRRTGVPLHDVTSGFRVISQPLLASFADEYPLEYLSDTVEALVIAKDVGASITEVPVAMRARQAGDATHTVTAGGHLIRLALAIVVRRKRKT